MRIKGKNTFTTLLSLLGVKYTESFSDQYFNEHPHKYNLYGLSKMLSAYGVKNTGLRIKDKEQDIYKLETPYVAHINNDFHIVYKVTKDNVESIWNGRSIKTPTSEFLKIWSGVILIAEKNNLSEEPNYLINRTKALIGNLQKYLLILLLVLSIFLPFLTGHQHFDIWITSLLLLNFIGLYICFLLVQKQLYIRSEYADKICSLFGQNDCNNILESDAAKFMGVIGWSEAGLGYFISNLILLLFFSKLIIFQAIINVCVLPYSFWSIWYQKVKAKQWCTLCLIVQILFWILFLTNICAGIFQIPVFNMINLFTLSCIYGIPFLIFNLLIPELSQGNKMDQTTQEMNSLKADEDVFMALLKKQPYYQTDNSVSRILLGNPAGNIKVTVFTNPHCLPCATMHSRLREVLKQNDRISLQYIFSSFNETLDSSNQFLISVYLNNDIESANRIFDEWFERGKDEKFSIFSKYNFNPDTINEEVKKEFIIHNEWKETTKLHATPTILVNGYKLPANYKIEDLKYFTLLSNV